LVEADCVLKNKYGLHMRPAERLVSLANRFRSDVRVVRGADEVNGKSIISIISLGAEPGTTLKVRCTGSDEADALKAISELIANRFGMEDEH